MAYQDSDRQRLDYSPESSSRGSEDGQFDAASTISYDNRDVTETGLRPSDTPYQPVWRDGETIDYHEWLRQVNSGRNAGDRKRQNAAANRRRDIEVACRALDDESGFPELDRERVLLVIEQARRDRESGLQFGRDKPLEATILAAISLVANERDWPIRRTDTFEDLRENFTPNDMNVEASDIRYLRKVLRQYL